MTGADLLFSIFPLALAIGAVVDVWRNGSIFAGWRARAETWENKVSELLGCSLCLTYQVAIWLTLGLWVLPMFVQQWLAVILRALLIALAAGRLSWVVHTQLGHEHDYDRGNHVEPEEDH